MILTEKIKSILTDQFQGAYVEVHDPFQDGAHLEAIVVCDEFIGKSLIQQQRLVLNALKTEFETVLHALKLKTYTFEKWKKTEEHT